MSALNLTKSGWLSAENGADRASLDLGAGRALLDPQGSMALVRLGNCVSRATSAVLDNSSSLPFKAIAVAGRDLGSGHLMNEELDIGLRRSQAEAQQAVTALHGVRADDNWARRRVASGRCRRVGPSQRRTCQADWGQFTGRERVGQRRLEAHRLTDEEGRRLTQIVRRGRGNAIRVGRATITPPAFRRRGTPQLARHRPTSSVVISCAAVSSPVRSRTTRTRLQYSA